jgi:hypothetical protein
VLRLEATNDQVVPEPPGTGSGDPYVVALGSRPCRIRCAGPTASGTLSDDLGSDTWTSEPMDHLLFGSDYPHPEGLREPLTYVDHLENLTDDEIRMVMGANLGSLVS